MEVIEYDTFDYLIINDRYTYKITKDDIIENYYKKNFDDDDGLFFEILFMQDKNEVKKLSDIDILPFKNENTNIECDILIRGTNEKKLYFGFCMLILQAIFDCEHCIGLSFDWSYPKIVIKDNVRVLVINVDTNY